MSKIEKWTPGPWAVEAPFPTVTGTKDGRPVVIADAQYRNHQHPGSIVLANEGLANGRLIAAAPELYAALKAAMPNLRGLAALHGTDDLRELVQQCDDALSAARGED